MLLAFAIGCGESSRYERGVDKSGELTEEARAEISTFCAKCHALPNPQYFSQAAWPHEVYRGFRFYEESATKDVIPPDDRLTVRFFSEAAPERMPAPEPIVFSDDEPAMFRLMESRLPKPAARPAIAHIVWKAWPRGSPSRVIVAEMSAGFVGAWEDDTEEWTILARIPNPAHLEWGDLDDDGRDDIIASDLGSFGPKDHSLGGVVWLRDQGDGQIEFRNIADGMGRVSEARPADFNGDGLLDLIVADFGWQTTGKVTLLLQSQAPEGAIEFRKKILDERHGAIRVLPYDLDNDRRMDFVALFGQEFEAVDWFRNVDGTKFEIRPLRPPADPASGSSGLEACDLDGDGDIDFVVTNGDMFDSFTIKPYHGMKWLENQGQGVFKEHSLITLPGVHGAAIGDLDLDGDLDIVTSVCFPQKTLEAMAGDEQTQVISVIWLEQVADRRFVPHLVEKGNPFHACQTLGDVDGDGDLDILVGTFMGKNDDPISPFLIWENLSISADGLKSNETSPKPPLAGMPEEGR